MAKDLHERLKACIAIELGTAGIYKSFTELFPEARDFWYDMAMDEENHASILVIGSKYNEIGKLPDYIVPESLPHMKVTQKLIHDTENKIESEKISLKAALDIALKLEKTMEESYLPEIMSKETDSEVIERLKRLLTETQTHISKVKHYIRQNAEK